MDPLALLCNLHADGPTTLQRFRRAGCETIDTVLELEDEALEEILTSPSVESSDYVARFQREAELLIDRLEGDEETDDEDELDVTEEDEEMATDEAALFGWGVAPGTASHKSAVLDEILGVPGAPTVPLLHAEADESRENSALGQAETWGLSEPVTPSPVSEVLAAWRSLDDNTPPGAPTRYEIPRPDQNPLENRALEEAGLNGLTPELAGRLAEVGVLSVRGLMNACPIELAKKLPLAFTRVKRFQVLARQAWDECGGAEDDADGFAMEAADPVEPAEPVGPGASGDLGDLGGEQGTPGTGTIDDSRSADQRADLGRHESGGPFA